MEEPMISYVAELRRRIKSVKDDDTKLEDLIKICHEDIQGWTGKFDLANYPRGRNLVFEYAKHIHNGTGEFFYPAYEKVISSINMELSAKESDVIVLVPTTE